MPRPAVPVPVAVGLAGGVLLGARVLRSRRRPPAWHAVTVLAEPPAIDLGGPLGRIRGVEVRLQPAPGDRGTEIHARLRSASPKRTIALRAALRDTKSIAETGRVTTSVPRPHGRRRATPWGLAQDAVERRAKGLGIG